MSDTKELQLLLAETIEAVVRTTKRIDDFGDSLLAIRRTLAELGPDFEARYAKHFAGPEVQQSVQLLARERELLLASARELRNRS